MKAGLSRMDVPATIVDLEGEIMRYPQKLMLRIMAVVGLVGVMSMGVAAQQPQPATVTVPTTALAEGNDYATRVLRQPWDFTNVSQLSYYLNESGQRRLIENPQIVDGVFRGTSATDDASFFPLFPGYIGETDNDPLVIPLNDKVGASYPIVNSYRCLHVALRSESPAAIAGIGPDVMQVFWFANRRQNNFNQPFGMTYAQLYPEAGANLPTPRWQVITIDLGDPATPLPLNNGWTTQNQWEGLRIDPTALAAGVNFDVDWVRLTDCAPVNQTITWQPDPNIQALWVRPAGTDRDLRLALVDGAAGSATVDLQGLEAGSYTVGMGSLTECCSQRSSEALTLKRAPFGEFTAPSPYSGSDYATEAGNPWDFAANDDAEIASFVPGTSVTTNFDGEGVEITTPPGPLPAGVDVYMSLNTPLPLDPNQYRYLTIDMETTWLRPWANIPHGMIGRWVWLIQGTSGQAGFRCTMVGPDIPFDVGRHTIMIDLFDPRATIAEEQQGECPTGPLTWRTGEILGLRFDPNENVTGVADLITGGGPFVQRIRSIRVTKMDSVASGERYRAVMSLSEAPSGVQAQFFYTTDRSQPTQSPALTAQQQGQPSQVGAAFQVYMPFVMTPNDPSLNGIVNPLPFTWDTTGVAPGEYYLCAQLNDGLNQSTVCSLAPVQVR